MPLIPALEQLCSRLPGHTKPLGLCWSLGCWRQIRGWRISHYTLSVSGPPIAHPNQLTPVTSDPLGLEAFNTASVSEETRWSQSGWGVKRESEGLMKTGMPVVACRTVFDRSTSFTQAVLDWPTVLRVSVRGGQSCSPGLIRMRSRL